ncbi:MAG: GAF domain-containing protein [Chlorobi bacterium]|nr:GAF domain-containing protein [Chlorobiota bacterium]
MRHILDAADYFIPHGSDRIAAMANIASLLYYSLPDVNWCGFYRRIGDVLVVGPFQGKPACIEIPIGRGVCGHAAFNKRTLIVPDVAQFVSHIACDPASRSEIVVPLIESECVVAVLDLDSPITARFTKTEALLLERIAMMIVERTK